MEDVAAFEQLQGQKELLAVGTHRLYVETHIFTVLLQHLSQVHAADKERTGDEGARWNEQLE